MNILTFDIEDWFVINDATWVHHSEWQHLPSHLEANVHTILNLLNKHDIKATFFVLGWVAEHFPELVKEIDRQGHEIGYHSFYHMRPQHQSPEEFEDDLVKGLSLLEGITGKKIICYRAPNLAITNETAWVYPILSRNGITISSSVRSHVKIRQTTITNMPVVIKTLDGNILEFPFNRLDITPLRFSYAGSGYFRIYPRFILNYLFNRHRYNMLYFHPRDFDTHIPRPWRLGPYRNWKQSINAASTLPKLNELMEKTIFHSLSAAADTYQHLNLQVIDMVPKYPFRKV